MSGSARPLPAQALQVSNLLSWSFGTFCSVTAEIGIPADGIVGAVGADPSPADSTAGALAGEVGDSGSPKRAFLWERLRSSRLTSRLSLRWIATSSSSSDSSGWGGGFSSLLWGRTLESVKLIRKSTAGQNLAMWPRWRQKSHRRRCVALLVNPDPGRSSLGLAGLPPIPASTFRDFDPSTAACPGGGVGGSWGRFGFDGLATSAFPLPFLPFPLSFPFPFSPFPLPFLPFSTLSFKWSFFTFGGTTGGDRIGGFELLAGSSTSTSSISSSLGFSTLDSSPGVFPFFFSCLRLFLLDSLASGTPSFATASSRASLTDRLSSSLSDDDAITPTVKITPDSEEAAEPTTAADGETLSKTSPSPSTNKSPSITSSHNMQRRPLWKLFRSWKTWQTRSANFVVFPTGFPSKSLRDSDSSSLSTALCFSDPEITRLNLRSFNRNPMTVLKDW